MLMCWVQHVVASAPEIFLLLAIAIGTWLGRIRIRGFAIGATACILIVAVLLGQIGTFVIPPLFRSLFFALFVFTIGYRSGPEFFASLSVQTLAQVVLALVMGVSGLVVILIFAHVLHLGPGMAAGLGAGSLTQTSMMGTAADRLRPAQCAASQHQFEGNQIASPDLISPTQRKLRGLMTIRLSRFLPLCETLFARGKGTAGAAGHENRFRSGCRRDDTQRRRPDDRRLHGRGHA
jgi:AspT/YidE/YbjL antiporter-like protein